MTVSLAKLRTAHAAVAMLSLVCWTGKVPAQQETAGASLADDSGGDDSSSRGQRPSDDEDDRLRGDDLEFALPRLRSARDLPVFRSLPALAMRIPYQVVGLGALVELVPVPWLRIGLTYAFGISPSGDDVAWGNYGEAWLGLRVFSTSTETAADIQLKPHEAWSFREPPVLKAWVPAYNGLFVEGGIITALSSLQLCKDDDDCQTRFGTTRAPNEVRQLLMPAGGLRYVHYYSAYSEPRKVGRRRMIQVYAHALLRPINASTQTLYFGRLPASSLPLGVRVGVEFPGNWCPMRWMFGIDCATGDLVVGVAPYPAFFLLEGTAGFPIY
jgi:hypothetical protein